MSIEYIYEASPEQRVVWLSQVLQPESVAYNVPLVLRLSEPVDVHELINAWNRLVACEEILRTAVSPSEEKVLLGVRAPDDFLDSMELHEAVLTDESHARKEAASFCARPLSPDKLWRARIYRMQSGSVILALVLHHILVDEHSLRLIVGRLSDIYASKNKWSTPVALEYSDWAVWRKETNARAVIDNRSLAQLRTVPAFGPPIGGQRRELGSTVSERSERVAWLIPENLALNIAACAQSNRVSPFSIVVASLGLVAARSTAATKTTIAYAVSRRSEAQLLDVVGNFADLASIVCDIQDDCDVADYLRDVHVSLQTSMDPSAPSFEQVIRAVNPSREVGRTPFAQVTLAFGDLSSEERWPFGDASAHLLECPVASNPFEFSVTIANNLQSGWCDFRTDIYDKADANLIIECLIYVLGELTTGSANVLGDVSLTSNESVHLASEIDGADLEGELRAASVGALFVESARAYPNSAAVSFAGETVTYKQLLSLVLQRSQELASAGVTAGTVVAMDSTPSLHKVVDILAIESCSAVLLCVHDQWPTNRIEQTLRSSEAAFAIFETDKIPSNFQLSVESLFTRNVTLSRGTLASGDAVYDEFFSIANSASRPPKSDVSYVIFTSGSTGIPKGVCVTRENLDWLIGRALPRLGIPRQATWSLVASLAFDVSQWEIWGALTTGGRLVVVPHAIRSNPRDLGELLRRELVDVFGTTPTLLQSLAHFWTDEEPREMLIICGGEPLVRLPAGQFWLKTRIWNAYGTTETTVNSSIGEVNVGPDGRVTGGIGMPLFGTSVEVCDLSGHNLPRGFIGELVIAGKGVAAGYLDVTARGSARRSFIHPGGSAGRAYRTGDLGRVLPDGTLACIARTDSQVKVSGFRVELSGIRDTIAAVPTVRDSVVGVRRDDQTLVIGAIIVVVDGLETDSTTVVDDVREHLAELLPKYEVPEEFYVAKEIVRTANGKADFEQTRLAAKSVQGPKMTQTGADGIESVIRNFWPGGKSSGMDDDFFESGGDSMAAMRLARALSAQVGVAVHPTMVFQFSRFGELSKAIADLPTL